MTLTNCPFDRLASGHTELVCGLNLVLVGAVADRLGCTDWWPSWTPRRPTVACGSAVREPSRPRNI